MKKALALLLAVLLLFPLFYACAEEFTIEDLVIDVPAEYKAAVDSSGESPILNIEGDTWTAAVGCVDLGEEIPAAIDPMEMADISVTGFFDGTGMPYDILHQERVSLGKAQGLFVTAELNVLGYKLPTLFYTHSSGRCMYVIAIIYAEDTASKEDMEMIFSWIREPDCFSKTPLYSER